MKDIKLVAQENIQIMETCCIIVVSIAKLIIMHVLQKYLETISSVLSSDGHLKPVCVCKLAHNYEHSDHSSLGCRFVLTFGMNHISEHLMSISFEKHKNWFKILSALGGVI